jgi:hypothetical protein
MSLAMSSMLSVIVYPFLLNHEARKASFVFFAVLALFAVRFFCALLPNYDQHQHLTGIIGYLLQAPAE